MRWRLQNGWVGRDGDLNEGNVGDGAWAGDGEDRAVHQPTGFLFRPLGGQQNSLKTDSPTPASPGSLPEVDRLTVRIPYFKLTLLNLSLNYHSLSFKLPYSTLKLLNLSLNYHNLILNYHILSLNY